MAEIRLPILVNLPDDWIEQIVNRLRNDSEAEWVEIVRCKDCKYWLHEHQCIELSKFGTIETLPNEFCSFAERRTDEGD